MLLTAGLLVLSLLAAGFYRMPPQSGPAPLWVSLLALAVAYAACLAVAGGLRLGLGLGLRPRRR
jgi:hypothetical protein